MRHTTSHLLPAGLAALAFAGLAAAVLNDAMISAVDLALSDGVQALRSPATASLTVAADAAAAAAFAAAVSTISSVMCEKGSSESSAKHLGIKHSKRAPHGSA